MLQVGFDVRCQQKVMMETKIERFKAHFGSDPVVHPQIWENLQMTENPEARISKKASADSFLQAIDFLMCYPTEGEREGTFQMCKTTARIHLQRPELSEFEYFETTLKISGLPVLKRSLVLLGIVPLWHMTAKLPATPRQPTTIEANHDGKGGGREASPS